jgi:competence protein ComEC
VRTSGRTASGALWRSRAQELVAASSARPLHAALFAAVVGLLCGPRVPVLAGAFAGVLVVAGAVLAGRARSCVRGARADATPLLSRAARLALVAAAALMAGAAVGHLRGAALERSPLAADVGRSVAAVVVVQEPARRSRFGGWSTLAELRGEPVLLRVVGPGAAALPGTGRLLAVEGELREPGVFAARRNAHAELRAADAAPLGYRGGVAGALDGIRRRAESALDRGLPPTAAGLLRGMVLGQDDALPDDVREDFRAAGLSHLVAASGTNVILLAALAMGVGTAMGLGLTARLWLVLALIAVYVPLVGGGASIQRAGVMGAAAVAAGLVGRPSSRWYALGLAAATTLVLDPRAAEQPGWQLSFVAVVSLLVLAPPWRRALTRWGLPRAVAEVTAMTAAATLATAPVVAAHFEQASLVAIPANILAAPAVAPVMWLGVVAAAVGQLRAPVWPAEVVVGLLVDGLGALAGFPLGYITWVGTAAARAPGAVVEVGAWPVLAVVAAVLLVVSSRRARAGAPAAAVAACAAWIAWSPAAPSPAPAPDGFRVTFLDVGQGDATLVQDGGRTVLVDAGPPDAGIVERLRRAGVRSLDLLVATHASADHEGGAAAVVAELPVDAVLDGRDGIATPGGSAMAASARMRDVPLITARAGQELRIGRLRLRVLWPRTQNAPREAGGDPNARAVVLEVTARGRRALLTADAESDVLGQLDLRPVDVLKVSHHGSADPGLPRLLERLRPRVAGIEVGAGNPYGHPAASTLAALGRVPVVVRTDRHGTVRVDLDRSGSWEVRTHA